MQKQSECTDAAALLSIQELAVRLYESGHKELSGALARIVFDGAKKLAGEQAAVSNG